MTESAILFTQFLSDPDAYEMFITGQAGTGKTTNLRKLVQYCMDNDIPYNVAAFTHKACGILRQKLPYDASITTLHKFLKKRPSVNDNAVHHHHVETNSKFGEVVPVQVLFVDEYSMVGEKDLMDLRELEELKIVWIGDPNQLPPVGDQPAVWPRGKYQQLLTHVYRQASSNPLLTTLQTLVSYIEGTADPAPLAAHATFKRKQDIVKLYNPADDSIVLAYTNERVQQLNAQIQGRGDPLPGDRLFSPTTKQYYTLLNILQFTSYIDLPFGEPLALNSKYKTLEYLLDKGITIYELEDADGNTCIHAAMFGHGRYKDKLSDLKKTAAHSNAAIGDNAKQWCAENKHTTLAKKRAKAWREYLAFNECVICLDFAHATTIHKSQGSTYQYVYLDMKDLNKVRDFQLYLRLLYVALSRASGTAYTND